MNIFEEIKEKTNILQVCDMLGIKLDRNYKAICPFHSEKTASFSISTEKQIFCCFGCGKAGDSIKLVSEIYNVSQIDAAKIINEKLNLGIELKQARTKGTFFVNKYDEKKKIKDEFAKWENKAFQTLCDYLHLLWKWEKLENYDNELFVEALQNKDRVDYLIDEFFINGTEDDKLWFWKNKRKELNDFERRIGFFSQVS